jgi:undecaprenyl-diphosphatase
MNIFQSLILSLVEGITEFLPISSTGHLILASKILHVTQTDFAKSFEIIIQFGAILAVGVLYFKKLKNNRELWPKLVIAFLPTAIIGLTFYKMIKNVLLGNSYITVISLIIGGMLLIAFEHNIKKMKPVNNLYTLSYTQAFIIGIFQSISVIPGISRAATTIVGGMLEGLSRDDAIEFSFLLAIPTMAAASGYDIIKTNMSWSSNEMTLLFVGFIGAFISALVTVKWFIGFVKKNTLIPFAYYRIVAGILFWLVILR